MRLIGLRRELSIASGGARLKRKAIKVRVRQLTEDFNVDIVFGELLRIFGHADLFEPVRNLLHGGTASGSRFRQMWPTSLNDLPCRCGGTLPSVLWKTFSIALACPLWFRC